MSSKIAAFALAVAFTLPGLASARPVTLTTTLNPYGGPGAYLAIYVVDASGAYQGTLWLAGGRSKYYRHLSDWSRLGGGDTAGIDGITGASVGSGRTLTVSLDLSDALIDAGYVIHIDVAVEDFRDSPSDVVVPLTSAGAGAATAGRGYIGSFTYDM